LQSVQGAISLYTFSVLGVFLLAAPWTPMWEQASLVLGSDLLRTWLQSGWVRGVVSGLGALDLIVAAQEAGEILRSFRSEPR